MLGYSDLLSASSLPPQEQIQAAKIGEQVRRTTTLVSSLLTFARQAPARLAAVDINSVLQTTVRLLAPQMEAEAISIRLELTPSLPQVLADSNQILHVCMHLAGQISVRLDRETNSALFIRTHSQGNLVLIDFSADDPSSQPSSYALPLNSEGENKPSTLSLSACCRIVEEHGGRLLQPSTSVNFAFRMELQVAANSASRSSFSLPNRSVARSSS